jgi:hypothetical protein
VQVCEFLRPERTTISSFASFTGEPSLILVVNRILIELIVAKIVEISTLKFYLS